MKIGYFGDGPWSHLALKKIMMRRDVEINFICARYPTADEELRRIATQHSIKFYSMRDINSNEAFDAFKEANCDIFISLSFNQIFSKKIITIPRMGIINCHAGKLPFYRGRNVLNWALINDEKEFGITVHYVDEKVDTGDIILQDLYEISDNDTYSTLLNRAYVGCADILDRTIEFFMNGDIVRISQASIHPTGFYCTGRTAGDENIDWNQSSRGVFNFIRAISHPGPGARTMLGASEIVINRVKLIPYAPEFKGIAGAILAIDSRGITVKTLDSFILIEEWTSAVKLRVGDRLKCLQ